MSLSFVDGSGSQWGTEYSLPTASTSLTAQTDDCALEGWIDFGALAAGDAYVVKVYETLAGGSLRALDEWLVEGVQAEDFRLPRLFLGSGWNVTVQRVQGSDRTITWSLRKETSSSLTLTDDTAAISTTEYSLAGDAAAPATQTTDCYVQVWVDLSALAGGDRYRIRITEKVGAGASRVVVEHIAEGARAKLWASPILTVGGGWDVTIVKLAGTTRTIRWSLRTDDRTGTGGALVFPALSNATTAGSIRDRIIELIAALTPSVHTGNRFLVFRDEEGAEFMKWCEANPQAAFRRYQVREVELDGPPPVSTTDVEERLAIFTITVAYPQSSRMGNAAARSRDDARGIDRHLIEGTVGMCGRGNFTAPHPDACWHRDGSRTDFVPGSGVDFLVITQTMSFVMQRSRL